MNVALNIKDYLKKEKGKKKYKNRGPTFKRVNSQFGRIFLLFVCLVVFLVIKKKKKASNRGNRLFCVISPHGTAFSMFHHWRRPLPVFAIVSHSLSFQPFRLYLVRYFLPHQSPLPPSTSCSNFLGYWLFHLQVAER